MPFLVSGNSIQSYNGGSTLNCEECGQYQEKIQIRKSGDIIIFIPDFEWIYGDGDVMFMSDELYSQLQKIDDDVPSIHKIMQLTKRDSAQIFLHELPEPISSLSDLNQLYLNTNAPHEKEIVTILQNLVMNYKEYDDPVRIKRTEHNKVTIILDTPDYFEWQPLTRSDQEYHLVLSPGYQVEELPHIVVAT